MNKQILDYFKQLLDKNPNFTYVALLSRAVVVIMEANNKPKQYVTSKVKELKKYLFLGGMQFSWQRNQENDDRVKQIAK